MNERTVANGRYVLNEPPLGIGGMGTVWRAFDTVLHREVAVKELRIPAGLNPAETNRMRERALREARAAAGLDHPGIVTIHDVVDEAGSPWIVMRLLPGRSLDQTIRADGPMSPRRAAELGVRLLEALKVAHASGVLHRDVKPQNVMLGGDHRWMLTDFGIASVAGATRTLTGTGIVTGTLGYVAPERLSGADPGPAADLWAVGATLYFAVEGHNAYDYEDLPAMIAAVLTRDPAPPRQAGPLAPIIAGLMERDPAQRWDADTALQQLQNVAGGYPTFEQPTARMAGPDQPTERFGRGGSTRVMPPGATPPGATPPGPKAAEHAPPPDGPYDPRHPVLRALLWQGAALIGAFGVLCGLISFSLADGMPPWIAVVLVLAIVLGGGIGSLLAPVLGRWLGWSRTLGISVLLMGESLVAAGLTVEPARPIGAAILAGVALVSYMVWSRTARATRRRLVPADRLGRATTAVRGAGAAGFVVGLAIGVLVCWGVEENGREFFDGNYVMVALVGAGLIVLLAALRGIIAIWLATSGGPGEPRKPWAPVTTTAAALVIPALVGGLTIVRYIEGRDDFTTVPNLCESKVLTTKRIAELIPDQRSQDGYKGEGSSRCEWERSGDSAAGVGAYLRMYDSSRSAARRIGGAKSSAEKDDETVATVDLGDQAIRHGFDGSIDSEDTRGVSLVVRIDNLVLEADFDHVESLGDPDPIPLQTLVTDLVQEIENQRPNR
ncbi:serine/threonine protein kinase [Kribbella amoyensis]|uniref:non-specific serine/threonine protein kinase n=1 Tax=Kribbella amoyensis TaxID=996641 RepID=A0A561BLE8_9ACTN|nr:bifunctional serine/threonine protein kinase/MFS transporter [Kribbella amoyensis]TWD79663.1 serine/threonine protein kinase [Kribbella amoyensis]